MQWSGVEIHRVEEGKGGVLGMGRDLDSPVTLALSDASLTLTPSTDNQKIAKRELALERVSVLGMTAHSAALRVRPEGKDSPDSYLLSFSTPTEQSNFVSQLGSRQRRSKGMILGPKSVFDERTEDASANQYFQFYGYLSQQQNMLQDYVRTATYQQAIIANLPDFKDKVVLDVGAGSGILSFFAAQAGARRVYAVEASTMAVHCADLVKANNLHHRITVVPGKIEEISLPEKVDVIISEPMGYMLLNERMLETYLHAKKFLKPNGKMYPTRGDLHVSPFTDEAVFLEQTGKASFWAQESFHGVNLSSLRPQALTEYFKQPIVDTFHVGILTAQSHCWNVDFLEMEEKGLVDIDIPVSFNITNTAYIHGLAFWFDVAFIGSVQTVWLSTAPTEALTHWYQVRCLFKKPILGKVGDVAVGHVRLSGNARQSYDVYIRLTIDGETVENTLDLKNPYFRYGGQALAPPPGTSTSEQSPTEQYWASAAHNIYGMTASAIPSTFIPQMNGGDSAASSSPLPPSNTSYSACPPSGVTVTSGVGDLAAAHPMTFSSRGINALRGLNFAPTSDNVTSTWGPSCTSFSLSSLAADSNRPNHTSVMEMIFAKQREGGAEWLTGLSHPVSGGGEELEGSVISLPFSDSRPTPADVHPFTSPFPPTYHHSPAASPTAAFRSLSPAHRPLLPPSPGSPFMPTHQARSGGVPMLGVRMSTGAAGGDSYHPHNGFPQS